MISVVALLRAAATTGDAVTMTYDDGSKPDALRIVIPLAVRGDHLDAIVDPMANVRNLFVVTRIASVRCADGRFALNTTATRAPGSETATA